MEKRPTVEELESQVKAIQIENAELRGLKQSIKSSEALHRLILESISDAVVITDDHGKIIYACPNSELILGLSQNRVYAKGTIQELINGNPCDLSELKKVQEIPNIEWTVVDSSGRERAVLITVKSISIKDSTVLYVMRDITERKQLQQDRLTHLRFLESMDKVNRAILGTNDLEQMMGDVLDAVLSVFDCDRAYLAYMSGPDAESWTMPMIRCRPEYPAAYSKGPVPMDPLARKVIRAILASEDPVKAGAGTSFPLPEELSGRFGFKSFMGMALHPKVDIPWLFAIHQSSYARVWNPEEERLFKEIGRRMGDALSSFLMYRNLQESEHRYRLVFENSPASIWEMDFSGVKSFFDDLKKEGVTDFETYLHQHPESLQNCSELLRVVDVNRAAIILHGAANKEELLANPVSIAAPETSELLRKELVCLWRKGNGVFEDTVVKTLEGESRDVIVHFSVCPGYEQTLGKVLVSFTDITDRKQAEMALRESRQKFQSMVDNIGIGVALIGPGMEILELNRKMREWFPDVEPARQPLCYRAFNDPPRSMACEWCPTVKTLKDGQVHESTTNTPQGTKTVNFRIISSPIFNDRGEVVAAIEMVEDITHQLEMESHLRQAQKMESIGNLAGGIAHDFNNILFPIIGMAEMLLEDLPQGSIERDNAEVIFKAGIRGSHLVKQILAFSRQSKHKLIPTRIQSVLKEVQKLSRASIPSNIEIDQNIQQDCGMMMADPSQIHQISMNIITNAYHAVEKSDGKISVTLKETAVADPESIDIDLKPGNYALLSFSDTGYGMSKEIIGKIFDPYFTTKEKGKGTGLGLAAVYGIVKEHNGCIKVNSETGKGSTFDIYLPLMERLKGIEPLDAAEEIFAGDGRILVVDDEEAIVKVEKHVLERLGYKVAMHMNSLEALEAFKTSPDSFDLVISDMTMPNITGDRLARKLQAIRPDIPIIISTGFSERLDQEKAASIGVRGFLMKPIVMAEMAKMVREVLDNAKDNPKQ